MIPGPNTHQQIWGKNIQMSPQRGGVLVCHWGCQKRHGFCPVSEVFMARQLKSWLTDNRWTRSLCFSLRQCPCAISSMKSIHQTCVDCRRGVGIPTVSLPSSPSCPSCPLQSWVYQVFVRHRINQCMSLPCFTNTFWLLTVARIKSPLTWAYHTLSRPPWPGSGFQPPLDSLACSPPATTSFLHPKSTHPAFSVLRTLALALGYA